ncbi:MAG: hypothetical protein GTO63_24350, partial [Anaerolineae bacterium]|nr:hypothetical protein [Anaerolineae bacterium]NIN97855.1 hypothetical protein [Anaerolineae bacterium]
MATSISQALGLDNEEEMREFVEHQLGDLPDEIGHRVIRQSIERLFEGLGESPEAVRGAVLTFCHLIAMSKSVVDTKEYLPKEAVNDMLAEILVGFLPVMVAQLSFDPRVVAAAEVLERDW